MIKADVVDISHVEKQLKKIPKNIVKRLQRWVLYIETMGLIKTRKIPGLHDEPLKGRWKGYRSVRLNQSWRVIYIHKKAGDLHIALVEEITKHEY